MLKTSYNEKEALDVLITVIRKQITEIKDRDALADKAVNGLIAVIPACGRQVLLISVIRYNP